MYTSMATRAVSGLLALALSVTMCPAAGLAYAAEGEGQRSASSESSGAASSGSASADRVNQDVALDTSAGDAAGGEGPSSGFGPDAGATDAEEGPSAEDGAASSDASSRYTGSSSGHTSADVPLGAEATVGTIEHAGLAYTINEDDGSTVSVSGLASTKPAGDVQIPAQIASGDKLYAVTAIKMPGIAADANPYAEDIFDDSAKALAVKSVSIPQSVASIDPAFFQLIPNAVDINVSTDNSVYTSYDGAIYSADLTQLILVPQGRGSLVLPQSLAAVPAYVLSRCDKLSAISFPGGTGNDFLAVRNNCLYTSDLSTLLAAPAGLGASASIASECTTIAEGAFFGNAALDTIVVNGVVEGIASAGDSATGSDGQPLMGGSAVDGSTLPAFDSATVANATVVINISAEADGDEASALIERAKAAWEAYGFMKFKEPAAPGTEIVPEEGSGFAFTLLPDYTLSVRWAGSTEPPAAIDIPDYGIIDGVQYTVSTIADNAFSNYTSLITADIPQTVTSIGDSAFELCTSLQTVHFDSVASIGSKAFANTALLSLVLPTTVQSIGDNAFSNMKETTIVAMGSIADNSPIALGAAVGLSIYVPYGTEDAWDAGIPTLGNHIYPYGVKLSDEPLELEVGQTANIKDGGYIEAPGAIEASYSYKANPVSINTDDGTIEAKAAGSTYINVSLELTIDQVAVKGNLSNVMKLQPVSTNSEEESDIVSIPQTISLAADTMNAIMRASAEPAAQADSATTDKLKFDLLTSGAFAGTFRVSPASTAVEGDIVIPDTWTQDGITAIVSTIHESAWEQCMKITSVSIPAATTNFSSPFDACTALESITVSAANPKFMSEDGVLYSKDGKQLYKWPNAKPGDIVIPYGVEMIHEASTTYAMKAEAIEVPDSVTEIQGWFGWGCAYVKTVNIPNSIKSINWQHFMADDPALESITLGSNLAGFVNYASANGQMLRGCSNLMDIYVKGKVVSVGGTFSGYNAFQSLPKAADGTHYATRVHLSTGASDADKQVWVNAGFLAENIVVDSKLKFTLIPEGMANAGTYQVAPIDNNIEGDVVIPSIWTQDGVTASVTSITSDAFSSCTKITSVTIPDSLVYIQSSPFDNCYALKEISVADDNPSYCTKDGILYTKDGKVLLKVPNAKAGVISVAYGVEEVRESSICQSSRFTSIVLPDSVTTIGGWFLWGCMNIESVDIPSSVKEINWRYFMADNVKAASLVLGSGLVDFATYSGSDHAGTLRSCYSIMDITVKGKITKIDNSTKDAFSAFPTTQVQIGGQTVTRYATRIHLPAGSTEADKQMWVDAGFLYENIDTADSKLVFTLQSDGRYMVAPKDRYIEGDIVIPSTWTQDGVTAPVAWINNAGFTVCASITSLELPATIDTEIGSPFDECKALKSITVSSDNPRYMSEDGVLYSKDGRTLYKWPNAKSGNADVPYGVETIREASICHLTQAEAINIPDSVTVIQGWFGWGATKVVSVSIPGSVTSFDWQHFMADDTALTTIVLGSGLSGFANYASAGSDTLRSCRNVSDIYVQGKLTAVGYDAYDSFQHFPTTKVTVNGVEKTVKSTVVHLPESATAADKKLWEDRGFYFFVSAGYQVTFDSQGGTPTGMVVSAFALNTTISAPITPVRDGYDFAGWFTGKNGTGTQWNFSSSQVKGDTTLYAKWNAREYTITLVDSKNGTSTRTYHTGDTVSLSSPAAITGYDFKGWFKDPEFTPPAIAQITAGEFGNKAFYAYWAPTVYTIVYNNTDGIAQTLTKSYTIESSAISVPEVSRTGYIFQGWEGEGLTGSPKTFTIPAGSTGNRTYTAKWTAITYTATYYKSNTPSSTTWTGATFDSTGKATASTTIASSYKVVLPVPSTTVGYTFKGWFANNDGTGTRYEGDSNGAVVLSGNTDMYACWTVNTHSVSIAEGAGIKTGSAKYTPDGGSATASTTKVAFGTKVILSAELEPGYNALSWSVKQGANDVAVQSDSDGVTRYFIMPDGDVAITCSATAGSVSYSVVHKQEQLDGTYAVAETESLATTADKLTVTPAAKTYAGFTSPVPAATKVDVAGGTEIELLYTRNSYTVTFDANGGAFGEGAGASATQANGLKFGSAVIDNLPADDPKRPGYRFRGWFAAGTGGDPSTGGPQISSETVPADDSMVIYAYWSQILSAEAPVSDLSFDIGLADAYTAAQAGDDLTVESNETSADGSSAAFKTSPSSDVKVRVASVRSEAGDDLGSIFHTTFDSLLIKMKTAADGGGYSSVAINGTSSLPYVIDAGSQGLPVRFYLTVPKSVIDTPGAITWGAYAEEGARLIFTYAIAEDGAEWA